MGIHARFATMSLTSALGVGNVAKVDEILAEFPESLHRPILPNAFCLPIHTASVYGHVEMVRFLLAARVDVNCPNGFGTMPLSFALARGHADIVLELLEWRADLQIRDSYLKVTPMELACLRGSDDECASLVMAWNLPAGARKSRGWKPKVATAAQACMHGPAVTAAVDLLP